MSLHEDHRRITGPRIEFSQHRTRRPSLPEERANARIWLAAGVVYAMAWLVVIAELL